MLFSCKISHSILTALDRQGEDLAGLYEHWDLPAEFLKEPSYWLEADRMEECLRVLCERYPSVGSTPLITDVGHRCHELRAWGVLDSVLRMVQSPKDIYLQPDRFLSYFISPAPPVGSIVRAEQSVQFEVPIDESQYPFVVSYLRAALEALPSYVGKPMAVVNWKESRVSIHWSENQESLFSAEAAPDLSLHPELLRNILLNLENSQKQLEETNRLLHSKDQELQELKIAHPAAPSLSANLDMQALSRNLNREVVLPAQDLINQVYRLSDYMARAQQLIVLLVAQGRQTPQVQEAMRRVDWNLIQTQTPVVIREIAEGLKRIQTLVQNAEALNELSVPEPELRLPPTSTQLSLGTETRGPYV